MSTFGTTESYDAPRITPAVQWLIGINVLIFFLQLTVFRPEDVYAWLGFQTSDLPDNPWTILSYMFVHAGFWHLAFNMYLLWVFGPRVEHSWSTGGFARYYVWCGLGGWLFWLLFARAGGGVLVGASAAVLGVMLAYAMQWPDDEVFLFGVVPMKVKWLVALMALLDLVQGIWVAPTQGGVAYLAHVGGLAFGWLYLKTPSSESINRLKQRISQAPDVPDETPRVIPKSLPRGRERGDEIDEIVAKSKAVVKQQAAPVPAPRARTMSRKERLNLVLDKISEHGMGSLTTDERKLLEEMSRDLRSE